MIIFIQFSITDIRAFTAESDHLLSLPQWPSPLPEKEFVRGSGIISARTKKGLNNWIGENFICKIKKGIKFERSLIVEPLNFELKNVSKHLFSSEKFVLNKFEFAFASKGYLKQQINYQMLISLISDLLDVQATLRFSAFERKPVPIKQLKNSLKFFHLFNSTKQSHLKSDTNGLYTCTPQVYIYLDDNERFIYSGARLLFSNTNLWVDRKLSTTVLKIKNIPVRLWIHERFTESTLITLNRTLRITILRLHSEYECLKNVLLGIAQNKILINPYSKESDNLQAYLNTAIATILKDEKKVDSQSDGDFIYSIKKVFFNFQPGDFEILRNRILTFNFRPQVLEKTIQYIDKSINIKMEEKYNVSHSQVGAIGSNAKSDNNTFQQIQYNVPSDINYEELQKGLSKLKSAMKDEAQTSDQFSALQNVAMAEEHAAKKDGSSVVKFLKAGGQWAIDTATKVGISVVTELIKHNM
ncbi:hypothetical protein [Mucilaginibacter aquaedulcis]|uniref:hypothetical protein n=1 Tax=Mucilaginibacter aquaedulcis TaxID=1187081 RepID=UPI0025B61727|nr:hypothetical protein [Mucilaginibacter aquaedulcis]MDN3548920.1 hypothetical protein [Mucilaginibacter aquaedulcis]